MAEGFMGQVGAAWRNLRRRAEDAVAEQEAQLARGRIAGRTVTDDAGGVIVEAGSQIDAAALERARAAGRLHALTAAAVTAVAQDLREKAVEQMQSTPEGREAHSLDQVDDFVEARRYVGRYAGVDVMDIRGNVIVPAGQRLTEADIRAAREAGQLSALIYAAQQPWTPAEKTPIALEPDEAVAPPAVTLPGAPPDAASEPPAPRRSLPLVTPPDRR